MALNIKSERVHDLARRAAAATGKSQTSVIEEALLRLLDGLDRDEDARVAEALAWYRSLPPVTDEELARASDVEREMYDEETGLPR